MADKKELVYKVGERGQDNLFAHVYPPARVIPITLTEGEANLKRGAVLYLETGKFKQVDEENKAKARAILKDDTDASSGDVATFAYATGDFNIHAISLKDEAEVDDALIYALQDHQIYLSEMVD